MKKLLTLFAFPALLCLMPLSAKAEVINTVTSSENIKKTSTVYVGEVVVDGESKIKYLYSGDLTLSVVIRSNLLDGLNGMADGDYADLLVSYWPNEYDLPQKFAFCSDSELIASMDENWSNAQYVGMLYFPDKTVSSEINSNLYDLDQGFKAALDAQTEERMSYIDNIADAEKCIVSHLGADSNNSVYYTVEDGQIIKHVDTHIEYSSEVTTVIYTKVELASGSTSTILGDVDGDGTVSVTDVAWIVNYILGVANDNFIAANADINGDGEIDINDVMGTVSIILEGDNTPQAYLSCPDDNHPHMIDLGLPSGTFWACCNVGATKPEDYGGYYAWGEVEEKAVYNEVTYQYCTGVDTNGDGWYDRNMQWQSLGSDIAGTGYDVAHVRWGGSWVMPSLDQIIELLNKCSTKWTTKNGVNGRTFTGPSGGTIFLPAAGDRGGGDLYYAGSDGYYWSSTQYPSYSHFAYFLYFFSGIASWYDGNDRYVGRTVRPVSKFK